jgi:hypothetical protein
MSSNQATIQAVVVSQAALAQGKATETIALFYPDGTPFAGTTELAEASGPVSSPAAPPSSNSPWTNSSDRNMFITLSATTAITAVSMTGANGVTASLKVPGSATSYNFVLPAGASYTPTYTGTLTATVVEL